MMCLHLDLVDRRCVHLSRSVLVFRLYSYAFCPICETWVQAHRGPKWDIYSACVAFPLSGLLRFSSILSFSFSDRPRCLSNPFLPPASHGITRSICGMLSSGLPYLRPLRAWNSCRVPPIHPHDITGYAWASYKLCAEDLDVVH